MAEHSNVIPPDRLVTLRRCQSAAEASMIAARLEAAGVDAFVQGSEVTTMLSYIGTAIQTARVEVPAADVDEAEAILRQDALDASQRTAWTCSRCDQHNEPAFELCWNCNKSRGDADVPATVADDHAASPDVASPRDPIDGHDQDPVVRVPDAAKSNPFAVTTMECDPVKGQAKASATTDRGSNDPALDRAFRAAVIGVFVFPPLLHIYAIYLLIFAARETDRDPRILTSKFWLTTLLIAMGLALGAMFTLFYGFGLFVS